jgi:hypothetical protein
MTRKSGRSEATAGYRLAAPREDATDARWLSLPIVALAFHIVCDHIDRTLIGGARNVHAPQVDLSREDLLRVKGGEIRVDARVGAADRLQERLAEPRIDAPDRRQCFLPGPCPLLNPS